MWNTTSRAGKACMNISWESTRVEMGQTYAQRLVSNHGWDLSDHVHLDENSKGEIRVRRDRSPERRVQTNNRLHSLEEKIQALSERFDNKLAEANSQLVTQIGAQFAAQSAQMRVSPTTAQLAQMNAAWEEHHAKMQEAINAGQAATSLNIILARRAAPLARKVDNGAKVGIVLERMIQRSIKESEQRIQELQLIEQYEVVDQALSFFNDMLFWNLGAYAEMVKATGFTYISRILCYVPGKNAHLDYVYEKLRATLPSEWRPLQHPTAYRNEAAYWLSHMLPGFWYFSHVYAPFVSQLPQRAGNQSELEKEQSRIKELRQNLALLRGD
ncbi:hypothetical protein FB45DRAFT_909385 [Roridomyces roridus]|uniref:Uncharacterized protein n=1 Tax=Roridomyces roridus TaxID=1738132 RepID=A0AAD7FRR7_9AGAR|nr:hypothetical protein FB45DRAFT_909385 [Roridomyces roridus]